MIQAGIIGATGYAGAELIRLLTSHPQVTLSSLSSVSYEGQTMSEIYPNLRGVCDKILTNQNDVIQSSDVVFGSVPHGLSQKLAAQCEKTGALFIDLGADFRLNSEEDYQNWYGGEFVYPHLHNEAVYAIPELFREKIKSARLIANPGCYPTSIALGLYPAIKAGIIDVKSIIIDSKSGVTGAGRVLSQSSHFPDCNENFAPYKIAQHRHTPEIEQTLSILAKQPVTITFVPHLLPVNRGILSTIYTNLVENPTLNELIALYQQQYGDETFVRVLPSGQTACIKNVRCSNYCDISLHLDERTGRLIVVAALDNMVKGAAGQAIQNMNLACNLPESAGLMLVPTAF